MFSRLRLEGVCVLALGLAASGAPLNNGGGPCDAYDASGTKCVAAHATTRALYGAYHGRLYQVKRASDNATQDIGTVEAGGIADADAQDFFCADTTCVMSIIYDQSSNENHLTPAPPGGAAEGPGPDGFDLPANAGDAPVQLNGKKVYGVYVTPGIGYRNNNVKGTAIGDEPQGMYAVLDGTHFNDGCCFDYGNAETNNLDNGNGHMETIYFGTNSGSGSGAGSGPWIMADLENGLYSGLSRGVNEENPTINHRFITAVVKGQPNEWAIRGADATSGSLDTFYSGGRPTDGGYNPMSKEGAIILGIGGDNSNWAAGTFYEGIMTYGYPSDDTENSVQANIVAAKYSV